MFRGSWWSCSGDGPGGEDGLDFFGFCLVGAWVANSVGDDDASELGGHVLEVVAYGLDDDNRSPILAIGEVKWGEVMGLGHLERLARIQALLVLQP